MDKRDIEAIESVKDVVKYCNSRGGCSDCIFHAAYDGYHNETVCIFEEITPEDWQIPKIKTYKADFLEKFPNANFEATCICRNCIYPNAGNHPSCTGGQSSCEKCWNEVYIEK